MKPGDKVYAAWFDYGSRLEIQEAAIEKTGPTTITISGMHEAFGYKRRLALEEVSISAMQAMGSLLADLREAQRQQQKALDETNRRLSVVNEWLAVNKG